MGFSAAGSPARTNQSLFKSSPSKLLLTERLKKKKSMDPHIKVMFKSTMVQTKEPTDTEKVRPGQNHSLETVLNFLEGSHGSE